MVIPPRTSDVTRTTTTRRSNLKARPRSRPPVPPEPPPMTSLPVSILPPALHALLEVLPPGVTLPLELLGPIAVQRTPLANATLSLWSYLLQPDILGEIFKQNRGRSFEGILKFSTFVDLIRDGVPIPDIFEICRVQEYGHDAPAGLLKFRSDKSGHDFARKLVSRKVSCNELTDCA